MNERVDFLELMRVMRRSAGDMRKVFLCLYGLLLAVPLALVVVAAGRSALHGEFGAEVAGALLRPIQSVAGFYADAFADGRWTLMAGVTLGAWLVVTAVGSFFGLAVTRMAAVEITCDRRAEVAEALAFARGHWHWGFLTPAGLVFGALALLGLGAGLVSLGLLSDYVLVIATPAALVLVIGAVVLILGLMAGGMLAWPAIATEWSDAFDAVTRVYGYSFAQAYRLFSYRLGGFLVLMFAVATRAVRASLVLGGLFLVLRFGLGHDKTWALLNAVLLEQPQALPLPQTMAAWTLLASTAIFLSMMLARLLVFRLVLRQAIYLLLRLSVDKVPLDSIDGYRPDDSDYDPTAQGFELVEVEEELPAE